jgi:hypothetical protein
MTSQNKFGRKEAGQLQWQTKTKILTKDYKIMSLQKETYAERELFLISSSKS